MLKPWKFAKISAPPPNGKSQHGYKTVPWVWNFSFIKPPNIERIVNARIQPLVQTESCQFYLKQISIPLALMHKMYNMSYFIEMKSSLGSLSRNFVGIELEWRVTFGSVTLVRMLHDTATFDEIVNEYDKKHSQQLVYVVLSKVIFNTLFKIIRVCRSRWVDSAQDRNYWRDLVNAHWTFGFHKPWS